jgi:hypothetical protein
MLRWSFMTTAWNCAKTSHRTLATKELAIASRQCTVSFFLFAMESFTTNKLILIPYLSYCPNVPTCDFFSLSPIENTPFWHNWGDRGRIACGAENPHRTWLPGCIIKRQKRWKRCIFAEGDYFESVGPKLVVGHVAARVPEIMDNRVCLNITQLSVSRLSLFVRSKSMQNYANFLCWMHDGTLYSDDSN